MFSVGEDNFLIFHTWLIDRHFNNDMAGRPHIYDLNKHVKKELVLDRPMQRAEINWIPLDLNGELYFTYSLDPLRVAKCDTKSGQCRFVFEQKGADRQPFVYSSDHLRGGTPWVLYKYPYYISVAHSVLVTKKPLDSFSAYNANIVVLCVDPWRVVYVSRNIKLHPDWLNSSPLIRKHTITSPFFYPSGIIMWSDDVIDISGHLSDADGHIVRMRGLKKLIKGVIDRDRRNRNGTVAVVRTSQQYLIESMKQDVAADWVFFGDIIAGTVESS